MMLRNEQTNKLDGGQNMFMTSLKIGRVLNNLVFLAALSAVCLSSPTQSALARLNWASVPKSCCKP